MKLLSIFGVYDFRKSEAQEVENGVAYKKMRSTSGHSILF